MENFFTIAIYIAVIFYMLITYIFGGMTFIKTLKEQKNMYFWDIVFITLTFLLAPINLFVYSVFKQSILDKYSLIVLFIMIFLAFIGIATFIHLKNS